MGWTTTYQGGRFTQRGYDMLMEGMRLTPFDIFLSQGGFNVDGVAASAGTHDREAWDIGGSLLSATQRTVVETSYRRVGCAAFVRTPAQGFSSYHIHVVPMDGDLSIPARAQVVSYLNGHNGLKGNGLDTGNRNYTSVRWETYSGSSAYRPPPILTSSPASKDWFDMATAEDLRSAVWDTRLPDGRTAWDTLRSADQKADAAATLTEVHDVTLGIVRSDEYRDELLNAVLAVTRSAEYQDKMREIADAAVAAAAAAAGTA